MHNWHTFTFNDSNNIYIYFTYIPINLDRNLSIKKVYFTYSFKNILWCSKFCKFLCRKRVLQNSLFKQNYKVAQLLLPFFYFPKHQQLSTWMMVIIEDRKRQFLILHGTHHSKKGKFRLQIITL